MSEKTKRRLEISITAVFVLALLLVGAVLIFSGGTASAKQIATLRLFGGVVEVQHGDGAFLDGEEGASLREGDTVRTGPDGRASIEYFDGSLTRLDYDTTFTLVTLETLSNSTGSKVIQSDQADGNSYNRVTELTDAESRFEVETPTATASVQGTVYAVIVEDGTTTIAVVEGVVKATGDTGSVDVPAGKMVIVGSGGSLGVVQDITQELLDSEWLTFNQCDLDAVRDCIGGETVEPEPPEDEPREPGDDPTGSLPPGSTTDTDTDGDDGGDGPPPPPALNQPPHAGFTASPMLGAAPLHVGFADASSDPDGDQIASRHWSFGDGTSQSGGTSPSHTYVDPGDYTVTLTVSDPDGEQDSKSRVINVGSPSDTTPPVVTITGKPSNPSASRNATFTFTSDEAGGGFVCTLDGATDPCGGGGGAGLAAPVGGSVSYTNLSQGSHAFSVSMTDASGNTGSDSYAWTIDTGGGEEPVFDHIVISPSNATIQPGGSQSYTAEAFDTDGGSMGNVTSSTSFSIAPDGSCGGNSCTATQAGAHTVTGSFSGDSDTATLTVEEAPPACPVYALVFHTRPPTSQESGHQFNVQIRVDVLEGGSATGPLTIGLSLQGGSFSGGETSVTWTGQGTVNFNHLTIDQPGSYTITGTASCATPTDAAPITIVESGGPTGPTGASLGLVLAIPGLRSIRRRR